MKLYDETKLPLLHLSSEDEAYVKSVNWAFSPISSFGPLFTILIWVSPSIFTFAFVAFFLVVDYLIRPTALLKKYIPNFHFFYLANLFFPHFLVIAFFLLAYLQPPWFIYVIYSIVAISAFSIAIYLWAKYVLKYHYSVGHYYGNLKP
tara:strand:- start:1764 stop:2207 length:444 start_codon:yes stop_codon:yes gene_type:complete